MIFKKLINNLSTQRSNDRRAQLYKNLIRHEARIGGKLFGAVPEGVRREFFCLDEHTWVWHEEWVDNNRQQQIRTTRYDIRPSGIVKVQDGHYQAVSRDEAKRLYEAARLYQQQIRAELYSFVPQN